MTGPGGILRELHIPWPAADEGALREAASVWHTLAESIRDACGPANSAATSLTSNNAGAAIDAFEQYWKKFGGARGTLPLAAEACDSMSAACTKYADEVAAAKWNIEKAGIEIGAALTVGTIGAFFTFGATEGAADVVAASIAASAAETIAGLTAWIAVNLPVASAAVDILYSAVFALGSDTGLGLVSSGISGAAGGVGGALFGDGARNSARQLTGEEPLSRSETAHDLLVGGVLGGGIGGTLGRLGELSAPKLATLVSNLAGGVSKSDPQLFVQMMELSRQLRGTTGKVTSGVLASVTSQLIAAQHIDAAGVASDQLSELIKHVASGGKG